MVANRLTARELVEAVESGRELHVLDVRAPARLASGRVDIVPQAQFHNIKGSDLLDLPDPRGAGLDPGKPIAVVCGAGNDSLKIAQHLNRHGFEAASLEGGISAWMHMLVPRELEPPPQLDRLVQFDRIGKGALGYLLVSEGEAVLIDPSRHAEACLAAARDSGARIVAIADTHVHADYISGGPALAARLEVPYHIHAADAVSPYDGTPGRLDYAPLADGDAIHFGRAALRAVHTPGHTEGSLSYRLGDACVFTGDFLFIGSVGRPDLGGKTEAWTKVLWQSLERAKQEWPAAIRVLPAHYASSAERNRDHTLERLFGELCDPEGLNGPLAMPDEQTFTDWVLGRAGKFPDVYRRIKTINIGLETVDDSEADILEAGRNECALG